MLIKLLVLLFGNLSLKGIRRMATFLRIASHPFMCSRRKLIMANLKVAFPDKPEGELREICTKNVQYMIEMCLECICLFKHPDALDRRIVPPAIPEELGNRRQGELWCALHLGHWEALSRVTLISGKSGAVVMSELDYAPLNKALKRMRSFRGTQLIIDKGAALNVARTLGQGRMTGILIDQNISPKLGGEFVDFLGLPAATSKLPAALARKQNVPIVICACLRMPDGSLPIKVSMLPKKPCEYASDLELTQAIMHEYERFIKEYPEQYVWMYRRWRYIPAGTPESLLPRFPYYARKRKDYTCPANLQELYSQSPFHE